VIVEKACPRCGRPFFVSDRPKPGRPRRWCSSECRRKASEERRAAESGGTPITYIKQEATLEEHVRAVLASPSACKRVLWTIAELDTNQKLDDAKWGSVADEITRLRRSAQAPRWRH
jgi:hypothetical protein